jgi:uncharacterized protein (DUF2249 family)
MKRAHALIPLSREHHTAPVLARRAVAASRDASIAPELAAAVPDIPYISTTPGAQTMATALHLHLSPDALYPFDARGVAKRFRHAAIFGALDALNPGETMRFVNDHDPLPLLEQLSARYGEAVTIRYVKREPGAIAIDFIRN